jgi:hypothetical protein
MTGIGHWEMDELMCMLINATTKIYPPLFRQDGDLMLLLETVSKIQINSHFITDHEDKRIGQGISIRASALNHSCRPNAALVSKGDFAEVRVMRDIAVGDEVTISYIPELMTKADRHKELAKKWKFICKCERCEAGDQPHEVEGWKRLRQIEREFKTLTRVDERKQMLELSLQQLAITEKIAGPMHPCVTRAILMVVEWILPRSSSFTETEGHIPLMLMKKIMAAWPITHGSDHMKYPYVLKLNEEVSRKFVNKHTAGATCSANYNSSGTPGIKATKEYKPGDVIIREKHFVHIIFHQFKSKFCDNCLKPL